MFFLIDQLDSRSYWQVNLLDATGTSHVNQMEFAIREPNNESNNDVQRSDDKRKPRVRSKEAEEINKAKYR